MADIFDAIKRELGECRRRLAPHTALQNDTDRAALNLAAVARVTRAALDMVEQLAIELEKLQRAAHTHGGQK